MTDMVKFCNLIFISNMEGVYISDYIRQKSALMHFNSGSWVVLSSIEQRIKEKIENIGIPLKNWDVKIYRGILTGYNEAFIISQEIRDKLIRLSPKNAEIIRPILRGRDIKKYRADWAGLYIINTHTGYKSQNGNIIPPVKIDNYPAIKEYLNFYYKQLSNRQDKGITPYHLRSCIYLEDFYKKKLIYPDIMRMPGQENLIKGYPYFYFDEKDFFAEATNFVMTGDNIDIIYLFLTSDLGFFAFSKFYSGPQFDSTGFRYKKAYLDETFIPNPNDQQIIELRNIHKKQVKGEDIHNEINTIWANIVGLNDKELEFVGMYKKRLLNSALNASNLII